jgi:hypothetical protein
MIDNLDKFLGSPLNLPEDESGGSQRGNSNRVRRFLNKKLLISVLATTLIAGAGFGIWKFVLQDSSKATTDNSEAVEVDENETEDTLSRDVPEVSQMETFKSAQPRMEFEHPANWEVTQTEQNGVRIESPAFSYQTVTSGAVEGNFRIYIRQGARDVDSKYIGRGVAIRASEKLTYDDPAPDQRTDTNLSLFGLDTTDHFAFFMIAGNFALQQGDTLGPDYGKEAEAFVISGGFSSKELEEDMATHMVPLDDFDKSNAYQIAIEIIKSLKLI